VARRIADRIVFGKRATPYEVLTDFARRMADTYSTDDVLPRMASIVAAGTGAASAAILLDVGGEPREVARWDPDRERETLRGLQSMANGALEELRDLARRIYPPLLADQGLATALEAHARRSPVPVTVDGDGVGRYPQAVESALYFCSLEALTNVAKYAQATAARIRLPREDGLLRVDVADDGVGFDAASTREGTGIRGMSDRLDAIGGRLEVRSSPGGGTVVTASVPVDPEPR
jgi:signal transduction histidine kinase